MACERTEAGCIQGEAAIDGAKPCRLAAHTATSVLSDYVQRTGVFHVLWPASKHPSPKVRALVDFLCSHLLALG